MTPEQIERVREWHKWHFGFTTFNVLDECLIAINAVLGDIFNTRSVE